tara:strand:+ start:1333 stop:1533 length:201 start_codon:yes stop_codon:yes gene_type:complete
MVVDKAVISLVVSALSGGGVLATWVDINEEVVVNQSEIRQTKEVHALEMGYIKAELSEIKQLIKDG